MLFRSDQARAGVRTAEAMLRGSGAGVERAAHHTAHATAMAQRASAELTTASTVRGYTEIRASVDGVVTQRTVSPGVLVSPGTSILTVAQINSVRFQANVAEQDTKGVQAGMSVRVHLTRDPTNVAETKVTSVFPAADPTSRTVIVEALTPNSDHRFKPGEYVVMDISTGRRENTLLVPASAVTIVPEKSDDVLSLKQAPAVWTMAGGKEEKAVYICTMHPVESKSDKPGKCPI